MGEFGYRVEGTVADVGDLFDRTSECCTQPRTAAFFKHDFIGGKVKVDGECQRCRVLGQWLAVRSVGREWAFDHGQLLLTAEERANVDVPGWVNTVADGQKAVHPALWEFMSRGRRTMELKGRLTLKGAIKFLQREAGLTLRCMESITGILDQLFHANVGSRRKFSLRFDRWA